MTQRHFTGRQITTTAAPPIIVPPANEIPGHVEDIVVNCSIPLITTATGIKHEIWGILRQTEQGYDVNRQILIATYNDLDTVPTEGKYSHPIYKGGLQYAGIGVVQTQTGGGFVGEQVFMEWK